MEIKKALEIVLELARQNIADQLDHPNHHAEQDSACDTVEGYFSTELATPMEYRTFELCDDANENFVVSRITRAQHEVTPELWALDIGDYLNGEQSGMCFIRSK